jgi:hypothetical protein
LKGLTIASIFFICSLVFGYERTPDLAARVPGGAGLTSVWHRVL